MSAETFDPGHLKEVVLARRAELDLSQDDVAARGGPSDTKLSQIENAHPVRLRRDTRKRLDEALEWEPGSTLEVMRGGQPTPLPRSGIPADVLEEIAKLSPSTQDYIRRALAPPEPPAALPRAGESA